MIIVAYDDAYEYAESYLTKPSLVKCGEDPVGAPTQFDVPLLTNVLSTLHPS